MASSPGFAATPNLGANLATTANASYTAPSTDAVTVFTAGSSGSRIDEIRYQGLGTTVAGVINVFVHDGSVFSLVDQVQVTAVTSSTTSAAWSLVKRYQNLVLKSGWTLRYSQTVASNNSLLKVTAFGADF